MAIGLVAGHLAAADDRKASLRADSREAYIGLLVAADSCADVADEIAVGRAYVEELTSADTDPDDAVSSGDDPILQAIETRDLCTQRLNSALAIIRLLIASDSGDTTTTTTATTTTVGMSSTTSAATMASMLASSTSVGASTPDPTEEPTTDDRTILGAASELRDRAIGLYDAELNVLKAEPRGEPFVSTVRTQAEVAEGRYNTAVDRFVEVAGADTREGEGFFGTRGWIMVSVIGAGVLAGAAVFLLVWSFRRRSAA